MRAKQCDLSFVTYYQSIESGWESLVLDVFFQASRRGRQLPALRGQQRGERRVGRRRPNFSLLRRQVVVSAFETAPFSESNRPFLKAVGHLGDPSSGISCISVLPESPFLHL